MASNGTFTSPNYPGLYPRNTECHYLFFGDKKEKVHITFPYFDVEGIPHQYVFCGQLCSATNLHVHVVYILSYINYKLYINDLIVVTAIYILEFIFCL